MLSRSRVDMVADSFSGETRQGLLVWQCRGMHILRGDLRQSGVLRLQSGTIPFHGDWSADIDVDQRQMELCVSTVESRLLVMRQQIMTVNTSTGKQSARPRSQY